MSQLTTLYINSKDRINYSNTSSTDFKINIQPFGLMGVKSFVIKSATIPFSNYVSSYTNDNTLHPGSQYFTLIEGVGLNSVTILIPFGNYSYIDIVNFISIALNSSGNSLLYKPYTVTYDTNNNKYTIKSSSNLGFSLLFSQQYQNQPFYKMISYVLGFPDVDVSSSLVGSTTEITSTFVSNLSGGMNIYIKSDTLTYGNSNFFNNKLNSVICAIPVNVSPNSIIAYYDQQFLQQRCRSPIISTITIQLVDEYDNLIDLNGLDWSCEICFYNDVN